MMLSFSKKVGYITKNGFDFYETTETSFYDHWISPSWNEKHIISVGRGELQFTKSKEDVNFKGYVRLVKSVHKQA